MTKFLLSILLFIFTLPVFAKNTILIVGDSLSSGYGISVDQSWSHLLQKRLDEKNYSYQVVNASISGDTTSNGLARLPKALSDHQPNITIIELGGNDGLRGVPLQAIKSNLQKMIALAKEANSKVILVGIRLPPNYGPAYNQQFEKIFSDLAEDEEVSLVPLFLNGIDTNAQLMQADRVHPTAQAQTTMLENVWPELEKLLSS